MKPNYEETVLRYKDMVYRIAFAGCPCRQDAEDVFQDVFLKLYSHAGDFSDEEHVKSWLIRVTLNCCKLAPFRMVPPKDGACGKYCGSGRSRGKRNSRSGHSRGKSLARKIPSPCGDVLL